MFDYTTEGCAKATEFLKIINKYDEVKGYDGWTIVAFANFLIKKLD